jgi:hypothetical protein
LSLSRPGDPLAAWLLFEAAIIALHKTVRSAYKQEIFAVG